MCRKKNQGQAWFIKTHGESTGPIPSRHFSPELINPQESFLMISQHFRPRFFWPSNLDSHLQHFTICWSLNIKLFSTARVKKGQNIGALLISYRYRAHQTGNGEPKVCSVPYSPSWDGEEQYIFLHFCSHLPLFSHTLEKITCASITQTTLVDGIENFARCVYLSAWNGLSAVEKNTTWA